VKSIIQFDIQFPVNQIIFSFSISGNLHPVYQDIVQLGKGYIKKKDAMEKKQAAP
jgi:hypothetical protein